MHIAAIDVICGQLEIQRFQKVPEGSRRLLKVSEGSKIIKVQGRFNEDSVKVPESL